jgi:hypothetical protein
MPLAADPSGMRVVKIGENGWDGPYYGLGNLPHSLLKP